MQYQRRVPPKFSPKTQQSQNILFTSLEGQAITALPDRALRSQKHTKCSPCNVPTTLRARRAGDLDNEPHLQQHTNSDISRTPRLLGVLVFLSYLMIILTERRRRAAPQASQNVAVVLLGLRFKTRSCQIDPILRRSTPRYWGLCTLKIVPRGCTIDTIIKFPV